MGVRIVSLVLLLVSAGAGGPPACHAPSDSGPGAFAGHAAHESPDAGNSHGTHGPAEEGRGCTLSLHCSAAAAAVESRPQSTAPSIRLVNAGAVRSPHRSHIDPTEPPPPRLRI